MSSNWYGRETHALIDGLPHGLVIDCGAGQRPVYFDNVVNYEIVDYDTTDVIGVGENLPFKDDSFDGVISVAVLEHVRDPFRCASEIVRVLKPGGKLMCCVPFLQPLHGYPHHYYNMSHQGLAALFAGDLVIDRQLVDESVRPIWSLTWIVTKWAEGLNGDTRDEFLAMPLGDLLKPATELSGRSWVRDLPEDKNFELASADNPPRSQAGVNEHQAGQENLAALGDCHSPRRQRSRARPSCVGIVRVIVVKPSAAATG